MTYHNQFRGFTSLVGIDIAKSVFQAYTCADWRDHQRASQAC